MRIIIVPPLSTAIAARPQVGRVTETGEGLQRSGARHRSLQVRRRPALVVTVTLMALGSLVSRYSHELLDLASLSLTGWPSAEAASAWVTSVHAAVPAGRASGRRSGLLGQRGGGEIDESAGGNLRAASAQLDQDQHARALIEEA